MLAEPYLTYIALTALLVANAVGVFLVVMQLPGTWLILGLTALAAWWKWPEQTIGVAPLVILATLAVLGELIEFVAGAWGARKGGGSRRAAAAAIVGAIVGAVVGSLVIPIPIIGTIVGACVGAGAGSALGDRHAGRSWRESLQTARGAAIGRFVGTIGKVAVAAAMWLVTLLAVLI